MSALILRSPKPATVDPYDLTHYTCCDDFTALCGYRLRGIDFGPVSDDPAADDCPACVAADQLAPEFCGVCAP